MEESLELAANEIKFGKTEFINKGGRPLKKNLQTGKYSIAHIRFTQKQYNQIINTSIKEEKSISKFLRELVLASMKNTSVDEIDHTTNSLKELSSSIKLLDRNVANITGNINQFQKRLNEIMLFVGNKKDFGIKTVLINGESIIAIKNFNAETKQVEIWDDADYQKELKELVKLRAEFESIQLKIKSKLEEIL